ncbi:MAG TPA: hypothetical protein VEQ83_03240, partial [Lapillicoccus sp.]|nr:hypothetical protein [Lapillicoccus sp.]
MTRRRSIWLVARRELVERGTSRGFLISVAISVALIVGAVFLPTLIGGASRQHLGIAGPAPAALPAALETAAKGADLTLTVDTVPDQASGEARLRDGSLDALLVIPADGSTPQYVVKSRGNPLLQQLVVA